MRTFTDPQPISLFDVYTTVFTSGVYRHLQNSWQHVFRTSILQQMPARELGEHWSPDWGRPSKELDSMAGLIFLKEFNHWTEAQAVDA